MPSALTVHLSPREHQIFVLMAQGMEGQEIAERLRISWQTVKNHIYTATKKFGGRNFHHAAMIALADGDIGFDEILDGLMDKEIRE